MKKIRQGNDFTFVWSIQRLGVAEDFSRATDIRLSLHSHYGAIPITQYTVGNGVITIDFTPAMLSPTASVGGTAYRLQLSYKIPDATLSDGVRECTVDVDAFIITSRTALADSVSEVATTSQVAIGLKGEKGEKGERGEKGDPLRYDDLTEAQRQQLITPALTAATQAATQAQEVATAQRKVALHLGDEFANNQAFHNAVINHPTFTQPQTVLYTGCATADRSLVSIHKVCNMRDVVMYLFESDKLYKRKRTYTSADRTTLAQGGDSGWKNLLQHTLEYNPNTGQLSLTNANGNEGRATVTLSRPVASAPALVRNNYTEVRRFAHETGVMPTWVVDPSYQFADMNGEVPFFVCIPNLVKVGDIFIQSSRLDYNRLFESCENLISVGNILIAQTPNPSTATTINLSYAFSGCCNLLSVGVISPQTRENSWKGYSHRVAQARVNMQMMFNYCLRIKTIQLGASEGIPPSEQGGFIATNIHQAFDGCVSLSHIHGVIDVSEMEVTAYSAFNACYSLQEVRLRGIKTDISFRYSKVLSTESLLYLFTHAQTVVGKTIGLHPEVLARLTDDQIAIATSKGWRVIAQNMI